MKRNMDDKYWEDLQRLMGLMQEAHKAMRAEGVSDRQFANVSKDVGLLLYISHGLASTDYQGDGGTDDAIIEAMMLQAVTFSFLAGVEEMKEMLFSNDGETAH